MSSKRAMKQAQKQAFAKHRSNISNSRIVFKKRNSVNHMEEVIFNLIKAGNFPQ